MIIAPLTRQVPSGLIASAAQICVDPETGATGSFFFSGDSHRTLGSRVSPVFADTHELFQWAIDSGLWESVRDRWIRTEQKELDIENIQSI